MASKERALKYRCKNSNKQMKMNIFVHIADTTICIVITWRQVKLRINITLRDSGNFRNF